MLCSKCGAKIDNDDMFCPQCGNPMSKTEKDKSALINSVEAQEKTAQINTFASKTKKKPNKKTVAIIAVAFLAVIGIITSAIVVSNVKKTEIKHSLYKTCHSCFYLDNGDVACRYVWVEPNYESVLVIEENDTAEEGHESRIFSFAYSEKVDWKINDALELNIKYGNNSPNTYIYSKSKIGNQYWHYDEKEKRLYIGDTVYRSVDIDEIIETDDSRVYRIGNINFLWGY